MSSGPTSERAAHADPTLRLDELTGRLSAANPELYRHLALYLQVLREVLPLRLERACFHLATQLQPSRYAALPAADRRLLHRRLQSLLRRCNSLLTVEQLCGLAAQMARERQRQQLRQRQELLRRFSEPAAPGEARSSADVQQSPAFGPAEPPPPETPRERPAGSVQLGMALPLRGDLLGPAGGMGLLPSLAPPEAPLPALAAMAEGMDRDASEHASAEAEDERDAADLPDPWKAGQMPQDPISLLRWLEGLEMALARRLRNLSHAVNVELLRAGLNRTLLPVPLLDAVLSGQLETQPAPPNLLRLPLPFAPGLPATPSTVQAVLLRPADLELEEPRLRTCRRRLQQHRQEVRRMAQQYRRLRRRREALEAERLWLQDLQASRSDGS